MHIASRMMSPVFSPEDNFAASGRISAYNQEEGQKEHAEFDARIPQVFAGPPNSAFAPRRVPLPHRREAETSLTGPGARPNVRPPFSE
jgi:hypothetical protein